MKESPTVSGEHKAMMIMEIFHGLVVLAVIIAATTVYIVYPTTLPSDLLGFVYGGAIAYAGGRASQVRQALVRKGDIRTGRMGSQDAEG